MKKGHLHFTKKNALIVSRISLHYAQPPNADRCLCRRGDPRAGRGADLLGLTLRHRPPSERSESASRPRVEGYRPNDGSQARPRSWSRPVPTPARDPMPGSRPALETTPRTQDRRAATARVRPAVTRTKSPRAKTKRIDDGAAPPTSGATTIARSNKQPGGAQISWALREETAATRPLAQASGPPSEGEAKTKANVNKPPQKGTHASRHGARVAWHGRQECCLPAGRGHGL